MFVQELLSSPFLSSSSLSSDGTMSTSENHAGQSGLQAFEDNDDDGDGDDDDELAEALRDTHFDPDLALAREMTKLSVEERNKAMEDVHAVPSEIVEHPEMVQEKLEAFDKEIKKADNHVYQLAVAAASLSITMPKYVYVEDVNVRLKFLRTDMFDAKAAARRMLNFLEHKLALFGEEKLNRDLRLSDLSEDDMETLKSGMVQVLQEPDRAGRLVLTFIPKLRKYREIDNLLRVIMYFYDTFSTKNRKNGVVIVYYNNWEDPVADIPELTFKVFKLTRELPCRTSSLHLCFRNETMKRFFTTFRSIWFSASLPSTRVRSIHHFGTHMEVQYELNGFGLPMRCFPISEGGAMDLKYHHDWIRDREKNENKVVDLLENIAVDTAFSNDMEVDTSFQPSAKISQPTKNFDKRKPPTVCEHPMNSVSQPPETKDFFQPFLLSRLPDDNAALPNNGLLPRDLGGGWDLTARGNMQNCLAFTTPPMFPGNTAQSPASAAVSVNPTASFGTFRQRNESTGAQGHATPEDHRIIPKPEDVLFGKGKPLQLHPGNVRFRKLLEQHREDYQKAPKFVKASIARNLVFVVLNAGSRFLKPSFVDGNTQTQYWVAVDTKAAQDKVSQYFRSHQVK